MGFIYGTGKFRNKGWLAAFIICGWRMFFVYGWPMLLKYAQANALNTSEHIMTPSNAAGPIWEGAARGRPHYVLR